MFHKLSHKILSIVFANFLFLALVVGLALFKVDQLGREVDEVARIDVPLLRRIASLTVNQLRQDLLVEKALALAAGATGSEDRARAAREIAPLLRDNEMLEAEMGREIDKATAIDLDNGNGNGNGDGDRGRIAELVGHLRELSREHQEFERASRETTELLRRGEVPDATLLANLETRRSKIEERFEALLDQISELTEAAGRRSVEDAASTRSLLLLLGLTALVVGLGFGLLMARSIGNGLRLSSQASREVSAQMMAAVAQQSASTGETASAVSETTSTLDELRQTAQTAAQRAQSMAGTAERSLAMSNEALAAVAQGIEGMRRIRNEVEGIARNILDLSEKNIRIGEIAESVGAIAEQSNLLAVNASIEAAKAGEHGRGFAVVAGEVRTLAGQSKEATAQIRAILAETQKASNAAVMVTEQGTKRVEEGAGLIEELGQTIQTLAENIEESADVGRQIALTATQQLAGVEQIAVAMRNVEQAARDNAAGAHQLERAAAQVQSVGAALGQLVDG